MNKCNRLLCVIEIAIVLCCVNQYSAIIECNLLINTPIISEEPIPSAPSPVDKFLTSVLNETYVTSLGDPQNCEQIGLDLWDNTYENDNEYAYIQPNTDSDAYDFYGNVAVEFMPSDAINETMVMEISHYGLEIVLSAVDTDGHSINQTTSTYNALAAVSLYLAESYSFTLKENATGVSYVRNFFTFTKPTSVNFLRFLFTFAHNGTLAFQLRIQYARLFIYFKAPTITQNEDVRLQINADVDPVIWTIRTRYYNESATKYDLYFDSVLVRTDSWQPYQDIAFAFPAALEIGYYVIEIRAWDGVGGYCTDLIGVTVDEQLSPEIVPSSDLSFTFGETTEQNISWYITDDSYANAWYEIFQNGTLVQVGSWISEANITIDITTLLVNSYEFSCIAHDGYGTSSSSIIYVQVSTAAPLPANRSLIYSLSIVGIATIGSFIGYAISLTRQQKKKQDIEPDSQVSV